jgi:hypothetical protein
MRSELLSYFNGLTLGSFAVSSELPWNESDTPLYVKNAKRIYVDRPQKTVDPLIQALDGLTINNEVTSVRVYFTTDAKQLPPNYESLLENLKNGKNITTIEGVNTRQCDVETNFENDLMITQLEFRFTKIT